MDIVQAFIISTPVALLWAVMPSFLRRCTKNIMLGKWEGYLIVMQKIIQLKEEKDGKKEK